MEPSYDHESGTKTIRWISQLIVVIHKWTNIL